MANKKDKKSKSTLSQSPITEPVVGKVNVSEEVVETLEKNHGVDAIGEVKKIIPEAKIIIGGTELVTKLTEEKVETPVVEEEPVDGDMGVTEDGTAIHPDNFPEEEKEFPRSMASLSKSELRWFQRTGMIPK